MEAWRCARVLAVMAESLFVDQERTEEVLDGPAPRAHIAPTAFEHARKSMPGSGRMQGRIRTGRPLPSQPLREHRGSRTRARYREKNAPVRRREKSFSSHFVQSFYFGFEEIVEKFCQEVPHLNQTQSGAIRRIQTQSACPELCVSVFSCFGRAARACVLCFCVLSRHNGPVFCVFVFWQTPLKTQHGVNRWASAPTC